MKKLIFALLLFACGAASGRGSGPVFTPADSPEIRFTGRAAKGPGGALSFDWSGSHFTFRFEGTRCAMRAADTGRNYYNVFVDGRHTGVAATSGADSTVVLAEGLERGPHTILVQKRTEGEQGRTTLRGVETDGALLPLPAPRTRHIEFIGDSHTCGYGTEGKSVQEPFTPETENCDLAWGCIVARCFDADYVLTAHSGQGVVRNWGDVKQTSDVTMRQRILRTFDMTDSPRWDFRGYKPDIVVIKLGTNDCSTGITPSEAAFGKAFRELYGALREHYGSVPILYVIPDGAEAFYPYMQSVMAGLEDGDLHCVMHFTGITNQDGDLGAGYHPNHRGHRKFAAAVIPYISTIMGWEMPMEVIQ